MKTNTKDIYAELMKFIYHHIFIASVEKSVLEYYIKQKNIYCLQM